MRYNRTGDATPEPGWTWRKPVIIGLAGGLMLGSGVTVFALSKIGMSKEDPTRDVQSTIWEAPRESYQPPDPTPVAASNASPKSADPLSFNGQAPSPAVPPELNPAILAARSGGFGTYEPSGAQLTDAGGSCTCRLPAGTKIHADQETASTSTNANTVTARVTYDVQGEGGCPAISKGALFVGDSTQGADFGAERSRMSYDTIEQDGMPPIILAEAAQAADPMGKGGVPGEVDRHTGMVATRVAIATVTGLGNAAVSGLTNVFGIPMRESTRAIDRWADQAIDLDPTLTTDPSVRRVPIMITLRRGICTG